MPGDPYEAMLEKIRNKLNLPASVLSLRHGMHTYSTKKMQMTWPVKPLVKLFTRICLKPKQELSLEQDTLTYLKWLNENI